MEENKQNENLKEEKNSQTKKADRKRKIIRFSITALVLVVVLLAIYLPLQFSGLLDKIDTAEELKDLILAGGLWSYAIYFVFQFLQATILPLPAFVTTVAGALVFGPWIASLISFLAILLASVFMFFLGRKIGRKLINWIIGEEDAEKWAQRLGKGKFVFFLMMLFPLFPDDILCLVVGTTAISFRFFFITMLIARPIGILTTCFLGSGTLIPFSGWGIPVWIVLGVLMLIAFYISIKYQDKIENLVTKLGEKLGLKKKKKNTQNQESLLNKEYNEKEKSDNNALKQDNNFLEEKQENKSLENKDITKKIENKNHSENITDEE